MLIKTLHILLAINLLFSTTGVTAFEHLCRMKGRTASLLIQSPNCCKKKQAVETTCHKTTCCNIKESPESENLEKKPCCEDKSHYFKLETNRAETGSSSSSAPDLQPLYAGSLFSTTGIDIHSFNQKILRFYRYKPPPLQAGIRVLIQSFLF